MRYFPILSELFQSNSIVFMLIGAAVGIITSIRISSRKMIAGLAVSCVGYAVCEFFLNIFNSSYILFVLFFVGTASVGMIIGLLIGILVKITVKK